MAKENLSIQIEYEKKEGGVVLKKLHGRCAELHVPAKIDGLPVIAVAERAFAAEKEAPPAEIGEEKEASLSFVTEPPAETAEGQALRRVFLPDTIAEIGAFAFFGLCRTGADTSAGEIDGGFQADVRWLRGRCRKFPCRGRSEASGIMRFTAVNG